MPKFFQIQFSTLKTHSNIYGNVFYNTVELKQMQNQMIFFLGKQCRFHASSFVCKTWSRWTFNSIINISSMYCFTNIKSGLFDIREYDVTEFHRLINYRQEKKRIESHHIKESLWLQMHLQRSVSNLELVQFILHRKWLPYRIIPFIWIMVFSHSCLSTVSMMEKSRLLFCTQNNGELLHNSLS